MAKNKFNKYIGAIALGAVILAVPSCSDDHFPDVSGNQQGDATKTLWELICENPKLTKFKNIAEQAKFWKDEKHPIADYTYADVLKSGQIATVWAPEDDSFSDEEYQKWLDMCQTDGYNLQQQFIGNHIALWRKNISDSQKDTIKMINGKIMVFDKTDQANSTLQEIPIGEKNIPAMNGTLHTIKGTAPFHYNFYEYLKFSPSLPILSEYIVSKDTTEFDKDKSIEGLPDKNGNPSYVDSVYRTRNLLFENTKYLPKVSPEKWDMPLECFHARINVEDSAFIMVMPTDEALTKAKAKIAHLYNYPTEYEDKDETESSEGTSPVKRKIDAPDSLANMSMNMDLTTPLVFNVHQQPKKGSKLWELEDFIADKGASAQFLLNTWGDTLRTTATWDKTSIFNGNRVKMSNGYGYEATEWAFPRELYNPDIEVEVTDGSFYWKKNASIYKAGTSTGTIPFNNEKNAYFSNKYGKVSRDNFFYIAPPASSTNPQVEIKLKGNLPSTSDIVVRGQDAEVMSGKYDIYVVMVPYWYLMVSGSETMAEELKDSSYMKSVTDRSKMAFKAKVRYKADAKGGDKVYNKWSANIEYDGTKVDTIKVIENFEFPFSYKNMRYTYPTLQILGIVNNKYAGKGFMYGLFIDRVIMRSKETGEETILDPSAN